MKNLKMITDEGKTLFTAYLSFESETIRPNEFLSFFEDYLNRKLLGTNTLNSEKIIYDYNMKVIGLVLAELIRQFSEKNFYNGINIDTIRSHRMKIMKIMKNRIIVNSPLTSKKDISFRKSLNLKLRSHMYPDVMMNLPRILKILEGEEKILWSETVPLAFKNDENIVYINLAEYSFYKEIYHRVIEEKSLFFEKGSFINVESLINIINEKLCEEDFKIKFSERSFN